MLVLKCCFIGPCWPSTSCQLTLKCKRKTAKLLMSIRIAAFEYLNMCARYVRMFCKSLNINSRTRRRPDTRATHTHTRTVTAHTHSHALTHRQSNWQFTGQLPLAPSFLLASPSLSQSLLPLALAVSMNLITLWGIWFMVAYCLPSRECVCVCVWLCVYAYCALFHFHSSNTTSKQTQRNCNRESSINRN